MTPFGSKLKTSGSGARQTAHFYCPGCREHHTVTIRGGGTWGFNEDGDKPTFTPSVLVRGAKKLTDQQHADWMSGKAPLPLAELVVCHSFVTAGRIQFLGDCTHDLAGQTVDLPDWRLP